MKIEICRTANDPYLHYFINPNRNCDYCATFKGYDEGDIMGFGSTPELAEEDLLEQTRCLLCGEIHYPEETPLTCKQGD